MAMAVTGLMLFGFVVAHMLGNLQIFLGQNQLNGYAEHLKNLPVLLWPARILLLLALAIHMTIGVLLAIENKKARPVPYAHEGTAQANLASRSMVMTGLIVFAFIVYHLFHFTFGMTHPQISHLLDPEGRRDVYSLVVLSFRDYRVALSYVIAMALLCVHLTHGASSIFQSLGLSNEAWRHKIKWAGSAMASIIFILNSSIPLAALLGFLPISRGGS